MDVLLTETAWQRFGEGMARVAPDARPLRMLDDGSIVMGPEGLGVEWADATPEVVWATADLFDEGAPLRPFFGFLRRCESLSWLQSPAAGIDAPVFAEVVRRGVRLTNAHVTHIPIAEHVLRSVLAHYQQDHRWRAAQAERAWRRHDFREVHGTTWLVIGVGAIGGAVAERARAFGAAVVGVRRHPRGDEPVDEMIGPDDVATALPRADVVVLSAPSTPETEGMVDAGFLAAMKEASVLVNVGRGSLVDEEALLRALDHGIPEAAVLDVTATEPLPGDSPLWAHPSVVLTPHNAAGGTGRHARLAELFLDNLARYREGRPLHHEVTEADLPE